MSSLRFVQRLLSFVLTAAISMADITGLSPVDRAAPSSAGNYSVTPQGTGSWIASSSVPWITVSNAVPNTSGTGSSLSGSGATPIAYAVAANTSPSPRVGTIVVTYVGALASFSHTVTQAGQSPIITTQPTSQNVAAGGAVTLTVAVNASGALTYQWRKDGVAIAGKTNADLAITGFSYRDLGSYQVVVGNASGIAISKPAWLTSSSFSIGVAAQGYASYDQLKIPADLGRVIALSAGYGHCLALRSDGTVATWGQNTSPWTPLNYPANLSGIVGISSGLYHNVVLKADGTVIAWGRNQEGQTTIPSGLSDVVAVAAGYGDHCLALRSNGTVVAWGSDNAKGQISVPAGLTNVVAIAAGGRHSLALKSDGTIVAWGDDTRGQSNVPTGIGSVTGIAAGSQHSVAVKSTGEVVAWGEAGSGESPAPTTIGGMNPWAVAVSAFSYTNLAIRGDGTVTGWGDNSFNQRSSLEIYRNAVGIAQGSYVSLIMTAPALPSVASITPSSATPGSKVTITGSNLAGVTGVSFGGVLATTFSYDSTAGTISATIPLTAKSGAVAVTTPAGTSTGFTYAIPLTITANPAHLVVSAGQSQSFSVSVGGGVAGGTYTYTWKRVAGGVTTTVGTNSSILYLPSVGSADVGDYTVTVNDGTPTSVTSISAALRLATPNVWTWRNPTTTGNDLWAVAYGAGRYVALGRVGTILTSTDGATWTAQTQLVPVNFTNVVFADSKFLVVGSSGNLLVSSDGLSWTARNVGESITLYGAARNATTWVVTASNGAIYTSADAATWTRVASANIGNGAFTSTLQGVIATSTGFMTVSVGGHVLVGDSTGTSWTVTQPAPGTALYDIQQRTTGGVTTTLISGASKILRSTNGTSWTDAVPPPSPEAAVDWNRMIATDSGWVALGGNFATTYMGYVARSADDGVTWTAALAGGPQFIGGTFASGALTAVGTVGRISRSTDGGANWQNIYTGGLTFPGDIFAAATGTAGTLVAGRVDQVYFSANHESGWTRANLKQDSASNPSPISLTTRVYGASQGGGSYVLVGGNDNTAAGAGKGYIFSSDFSGGASGSTWTRVDIDGPHFLAAVAYEPVSGRFVTAGAGNKIYYANNPALSSGADGWTAVDKPGGSSVAVRAATAAGGRFVLTGDNGVVFTSADGVAWTAASAGIAVSLEAVAGNGAGTFVAGGWDGASSVLMRSTDNGATWSRVSVPFTGLIRGMAYADGRFRTVGANSTMLISADAGATWTAETSQFSGVFRAIVRTPKGYVAGGSNGAIATLSQPTASPVISDRTLTAGANVSPFRPVVAAGGAGNLSYSVFPALPAGLSLNSATGEITGGLSEAAAMPLFVGSDNFATDNLSTKWPVSYRTLGAGTSNGSLSVNTTAGRLDFSKGAGEGSFFRRWDGDPLVANSTRSTASFATSWQADVTVTNNAAVSEGEYSSVGLQAVSDGGWAAIMVTRNSTGITVRGESSSIASASSPVATIASGEAVRLRFSWDAATRTLKGAYSINGGVAYTDLLTLPSTSWVGSSSRGFVYELFANSTIAAAVAVGSNHLDDFSVSAKSVASGIYTLTVTDGVGVTASVPVTVRVLPADSVLWQQFTQSSSEQAPGRTIHASGGKVYVPWSVYDRNPDMVGGRLVGPLARLNESDGSLDTTFRVERYIRAVNHVVPLPDGKLLAAVRVGDVDAVGRLQVDGTLDASFTPAFFARGVRFITLQSDGKVLVVAADNLSANAPAGALATSSPVVLRLNADGTQDTSFSVVLNDGAILFAPPVVDSTGRVYLAGAFSTVNGTSRTNIARVSSAGVLDSVFADPASVSGFGSNQARAVLLPSDGNVVVLGDFRSTARGTFSNPMMAIRFTSTGAYDETYARPLRSELGINTAVGIRLRHGVLQPDGKIVAVSDRLVRLNSDGTRDTTFVSRAFGKEAVWVSRADDGRFFVADQISVAAADGSTVSLANNGIACFAADGTPDFSFQTGGWGRSAPVTSGLPLNDGRVWVAGSFNRYGGSPVPGVAQFTSAGALSTTQVVSGRLMSNAMVVPAGSDKAFLLAVTAFNSLETYSESLIRIGADGSVDTSFSPALPAGYSLGSASLFESPGGKVILFQNSVGAQAILNGETGDGLLRLNADGTRDTAFISTLTSFATVERNSSNAITMIRTGGFGVGDVLADGRVLAGGAGVDGSVKLVRLKADGSVDTAFTAASLGTVVASTGFTSSIKDPVTNTTAQFPISNYDASNLISALRQGPDGKVYVGGRLALSGAPRGLVRLSATGAIDTTFSGTGLAYSDGPESPAVVAMVFDDSGRLYVAGRFDTFNGNPVPGLFRLKSDGTFDSSWQPGIGIDRDAPRVSATMRVSGGKLYAFGTVMQLNDSTLRSWVAADIGSAPVIASISPANAAAGSTVTISGSNLAGVTRVSFGGLGASFTYNSTAGTISATVPPGATSGPVEVTTAAGSSAGFNFTVPLVIAAQPASAVVRNGSGFFLQVRATGGTPPYAFQWRKGTEVLAGASSPAYSRNNVGSAETGAYNVIVTDAAGASVTSSTAVVSLASVSETFLSDAAFTRPDFKQDSLAGRVTIDAQGRTYATWTNGNYLSGVGAQLRGAVIRLKPDGTLDDTFNIGSALVDAWPVVPLPDGKVLVGGIASNESMETGYAMPRVFRFNADGSRDYSYNSPHFAALPRFMTLQPDGRLLVVASSSTTGNGGIPVMARLNPDGSPDGSFMQPVLSANGSIFCPPVLDAPGKIYVGGIFSTINGVARPAVARLNPDGSVDTTWTPSGFTVAGNVQVRGLALQTQGGNAGKLLVAGGALYVTGSTVNRPVIRLNPSGDLDSTFMLVTQADAGMSVRPRLLVSLPDDRFYVVGSSVTRFLANGAVDTGYVRPAFSTEFFWMDAMADGRVVVPPEAGATVNGAPTPSLVRFTAAGALDTSFAPSVFNREIYPGRFAVVGDGKVLTWGSFDRANGTSRPGIALFNLNGSLDTAFNVSGIADLKYVAFAEVGSDGKILAGTRIGPSPAALTAGISRLNADGTVDGSFTLDSQLAGRTDGLEFRLLPDNKVAVWSITAQGVVSNNNIIGRLTAAGAQDATFTASGFDSFGSVYRAANGAITSITLGAARILAHDANGRLIGRATTGSYPANATSLNYTLVRVNTDGSRDMTFSAPVVAWSTAMSFPFVTDAQTNGGVAGQVQTTVVSGAPFSGVLPLADGKYLVFGGFQSLSGQTARGLARLSSTGALDTSFSVGSGAELRYQPGRFAQVQGVSVAADGKLWVTGAFDTFSGYAAPGIVRLNADGTVDTTFATDIVYQSYLGGLAQVGFASNGTVYVSGTYARPGEKFPTAFQALVNAPAPSGPVFGDLGVGRRLVAEGQSLTLQPAVSGASSYQWKRNGLPIAGANSVTLTLNSVSAVNDAGRYELVAFAGAGQTGASVVSPPIFVVIAFPSAVAAWGGPFAQEFGALAVPAGLSDVVAIAAGSDHSLALRAGGSVVAWGRVADGALAVPPGLDDAVAVSAGSQLSAVLRANGSVVTWGFNTGPGQPAAVPPNLGPVVAISAGSGHLLALRSDGTVVAWGNNDQGQATVPAGLGGVVAVSAGGLHSLALKADGTVVAWGGSTNGAGINAVPGSLTGVKTIWAGNNESVAVREDGSTVTWGQSGSSGSGLSSVRTAAISTGGLALKNDGSVLRWGPSAVSWVSGSLPADVVNAMGIGAGSDHAVVLRRAASSAAQEVAVSANYLGTLATDSVYAKAINSYRRVAVKFVPSATVSFSSARLNLGASTAGSAGSVRAFVHADSAGAPGQPLLTLSTLSVDVRQDYTFTPTSGALALVQGVPYWIVLEPATPGSGSAVLWHAAGTDQLTPWGYGNFDGSAWQQWTLPSLTNSEPAKALQVFGTLGGGGPQYGIAQFGPQPLAPGGELTLTGTFPTSTTPVITLESGGSTPVATLTAGSNSASQIKATLPTGTASGTYGLKVKFGTPGTSGYVEMGVQNFAVGTGGGTGSAFAINQISPNPLTAGTTISLSGNFPTTGTPLVTLESGGSPIATLTSVSQTGSVITATVPGSTPNGTYAVRVTYGTAPNVTSGVLIGVTVAPDGGTAPTISSVLPNPVAPGAVLTMTGTNYPTGGVVSMELQGSPSPVLLTGVTASATQIAGTVPASATAGTYNLKVTFGNGASIFHNNVTIGTSSTSSPTITSVTPNPIIPGGSITINGANLPASGTVTAKIGNVSLTNVATNAPPMGITASVPSTVPTGAQVLTVNLPGGGAVTFQVNVSGGNPPTLSVDGVVRAWEIDTTRVGAVVNSQVFNVWTKVTAGLGSNTNLNPPPPAPANWGRLLSSTGFTSIAGELGITFKFGDLFFNPATFVSGANGNNGGITVQEYVPSLTARTPVEFYDSTGAILAKGFMEKVVNRVVYSTGAATGEAVLVLNATGPAAKSAAFLQEILQLTRGTGRLSVLISSYVATVFNSGYFDYLSTGSISAAPIYEAARFIASASSMAKVPASGSQVTFRIPLGGNRKVLVRAVVSALPALGVTSGLLADPQLTLKDAGGATLQSNDDWGSASNAASIETVSASVGAVAMVAGGKDAAILTELAPGAYTVEVKDAASGSGLALVELYAPENLGVSTFTHVALQGPAGGADGSQMLGFFLGGGAVSDVLVRSVGPALGAAGLEDPRLNLTSGQSQQIAANDNWDGLAATSSAFTQAAATLFASGSKDSAVLLRVGPGAYVASSSAPAGAASGVVRTEVFLLPGGTVDALIHTADLDRDGRIALLELTRVIELYNTRNGTTRTGCYSVATTSTEDGFAADSARASAAVVTLPRYHSADSNRDGRISLTELTRVIELYNYRSGTTRTGQYKPQTGTEDGFAAGP